MTPAPDPGAAFRALGAELRAAGSRPGEHVLFGSSVLYLHGLREAIGDVDLFVTPAVWRTLCLARGWLVQAPDPDDPPLLELPGPLAVHAFYAWRAADAWMDVRRCFELAEVVRGWPCVPLAEVRRHKQEAWAHSNTGTGEAKHLADVRAIDEHLRRAA